MATPSSILAWKIPRTEEPGGLESISLQSQTRLSDFHIHTGNFRASQVAPEVKNAPANAGDIKDAGLIPGLERSPREGNGNPLQYSCLENPMDRGAWQATVHGVAKSQIRLNFQKPNTV